MEPTREAATFCEARGATCDAELLAAVIMTVRKGRLARGPKPGV